MAELPPLTTTTTMQYPTLQPSVSIASMDKDGGNVRIDWGEVEKQSRGRDPYLMPLAKLLLAVRDRNYQPTAPQ